MSEVHKPTFESTTATELPELAPSKNGKSQARMYINKQNSQAVTKDFLHRKLAQVVSEYTTNDGRKHRDRESASKSLLDPLLMGTTKKLELRRHTFKEEPKQQTEEHDKQPNSVKDMPMARRSLPRPKLMPSKEPSSKQRSDSILKPNVHHHDNVMNEFMFTINLSNGLVVNNKKDTTYRAFIDKGNNGLLLKSVVKRRWWWHLVDEVAECNLLWTEWNTRDFTQKLPCLEKDNSGRIKSESEESAKQLGSLKTTVRAVENMVQKTSKIGRLINLQLFTKLNLKISQEQDSYYVFSRRLTSETPVDVAKALYVPGDQPLVLDDQETAHIHNHVEGVLNLHSKKLLLSNLRKYYTSKGVNPYENIPLTFHVKEGTTDEQFLNLINEFQSIEKNQQQLPQPSEEQTQEEKPAGRRAPVRKAQQPQQPRNVWICKPGENSNRGNGITVVDKLEQLIDLARSLEGSTTKRSLIIQKYIENPFLIEKRKFDIRCYILITTYNGCVKGYWFEEGYIRTASEEYTLEDVSNKLVHLTNDAIQKKGKEYGRFESANKMSFVEFQEYLTEKTKMGKVRFPKSYEQMKAIAKDLIDSVHLKLNPKRKQFAFELFGLDFMLDSTLKPWLIEANSNPCLDTTGPLLGRLIPDVVENVFKVAIDPIFPPPNVPPKTKCKAREDYFERNRFCLIFDSLEQPSPPNAPLSTKNIDRSKPQEQVQP